MTSAPNPATPNDPQATTPPPDPQESDVAVADEAAKTDAGNAPPTTEVERLRAELKALQEDRLRRIAEFQNYRRRTEQERSAATTRGREDAVLAILDAYDDLRRALDAAEVIAADAPDGTPHPAYDALHEGVDLVHQKFTDVLARLGVKSIEAVGHPFDESLHDALMQQPAPDPDTPSGTVLAAVQPGYRMGDRVLRHAQVIVAQ